MKPINKIKLNYAYDKLKLDNKGVGCNVGIPNMNFEGKTKTPIIFFTPYNDLNTEVNTVEYFYKKKQKFIYAINFYSPKYHSNNPYLLPPLVLKSVNEGLAKIVFKCLTEGEPYSSLDFYNTTLFGIHNNLTPTTFYILDGNLLAQKNYKLWLKSNHIREVITFLPSFHFEDSPWFIEGVKYDSSCRIDMWQFYEETLYINRLRKLHTHFLCYQRRPRFPRIWIYNLLSNNPLLKNKISISLGKYSLEEPKNKGAIEHVTNIAVEHNRPPSEIETLKNLDLSINHTMDGANLDENQATSFDRYVINSHFLHIVVETLTDPNTIFFSEKTFRPIYALQPFILVGSKHQLKKLKEMGYKTFSKYWSEEYDRCEHYMDRMAKIQEVLEEISTWSLEKCQEVYLSMEEILTHNFHQLMKLDRYYSTLKELDCD